jgi:hypothetical protein
VSNITPETIMYSYHRSVKHLHCSSLIKLSARQSFLVLLFSGSLKALDNIWGTR